MKASETKLLPLIEGTKQYVVPMFQRSYSWHKKHWEVLWQDLTELCEMENPRSHFIGSIVTMPSVSVPEGVTKYLLIDGQQRLTTIFILLALLRDIAIQQGQPELAAEIDNTLLVNPYKKDSDYYKLLPTQIDRDHFRALIQSESGSHVNQMVDAYNYYDKKLRQTGTDIQQLKGVITSNLSVVSIVLDLEDNPYLVFESLNAKGEPLSQADLIRNYFFMRIHVDEQEEIYARYWKPMQHALGSSLTEFIRHYLMKNGTVIKQNDVYISLKELVRDGDALECLQDLARFATYYDKFLHPANESHAELRRRLIRLNRMELTVSYPFLLICYDNFDAGRLALADFIDILDIIENFIIRRFICNILTTGLNRTFPALHSQVMAKKMPSFVEGLKVVLQAQNYPRDAEFAARFKDAKLYGVGDRLTRAKLILETIEETFGHKEQVAFSDLTVEHVMPQTLTEWWQNHLGEDWGITHDLWLHTIGNLTLTAYNSELSNDTFLEKHNRLSKSHLEINKYFTEKHTWNKDDIEQRASYLAHVALNIWPYFGKQREAQESTDVTGTTPHALWILGQSFEVHSWRDVMEQTMNTIADLEPDKFEQIMQEFPRFVGRDKRKFRVIRELNNGAYIEVNLQAKSIQSFCFQAISTIDLTADEWKVNTT